jgi:hypothetical protein
MAFIETELAKRRGGPVDKDAEKNGPVDPQDELYRIAEKYRLEQKKPKDEDEGNVTTSLGMLTSIPEVDLGMEWVCRCLCSVLYWPLFFL